ncbi:MAG: hypothetical protein L0170_08080, partial [Acidobacteria bacterium]|nr:hypothetical protein [Acidobacteriota bacterium]
MEHLPKSRTFAILRYTLIIATAYLLLVEHEFASPPTGFILLIAAALVSNVAVTLLPARIIDSTAFHAGIILGDTLWITAALLYSGRFHTEFFTLYFFVLLLAVIGENLELIAVGAVVVCIAYIFALSTSPDSALLSSSQLLIRIPFLFTFLFTAAAFYGYLVDRIRREQQRTREQADAVARLEEIQRKLAEHALQVERVNEDLAREVAARTRVEEALQHARDQLRAVLDAVPAWVSWIGSDLKYLGVNRHMASVLQAAPEEFVGREVGFLGASPEFIAFVRHLFSDSISKA